MRIDINSATPPCPWLPPFSSPATVIALQNIHRGLAIAPVVAVLTQYILGIAPVVVVLIQIGLVIARLVLVFINHGLGITPVVASLVRLFHNAVIDEGDSGINLGDSNRKIIPLAKNPFLVKTSSIEYLLC